MRIDVVSDTVCPWCYVGKYRLAKALDMRPEVEADVQWRPFRLDPTVPREGVDYRDYLRARFGENWQAYAAGGSLRDEAMREGIPIHFERITRIPNTLSSHCLIRWAGDAGVQDDVVERIFAAHFVEGRDIGDPAVLAWIAAEAGMDSDQVAEALANDVDRAAVEEECAQAARIGISGVPAFIFDNKFIVSGAHPPKNLANVIDKVLESDDEDSKE